MAHQNASGSGASSFRHRGGVLGRRSLGGLLVVGLALAGFQLACNDNNGITAPPPPPQQDPSVAGVVSAGVVMLIEPLNENREYPRGGEVAIDGRVVWSGPIHAPQICCSSYYDLPPFNVSESVNGDLAAGAHTLTFRVTDQRRSPTGYNLSGWVTVDWGYFRGGTRVGNQLISRRVADWQDAQARLRTGEAWSLGFTVPEGPN